MKTTRILFTKENRAKSLAGTKTQTRRVIVPQPKEILQGDWTEVTPYGQAGDRLAHLEPYKIFRPRFAPTLSAGLRGNYLDDDKEFCVIPFKLTKAEWDKWTKRKRPYAKTSSRYMYNSLIRYWYEITGVRVERVQDISRKEAEAEGCKEYSDGVGWYGPEVQFCQLWDSINKKRGYEWDVNPYVFVYTYRRTE